MSAFAVEARYPEFEEPSLEDTKNAVKIAEKIKEFIKKKILENTDTANSNTES